LQNQEERKLAKLSRPKKRRNIEKQTTEFAWYFAIVQHSATSTCIVEIEPLILHAICEIWKIDCTIYELQPSICMATFFLVDN